jgi:hypothetical protein
MSYGREKAREYSPTLARAPVIDTAFVGSIRMLLRGI